VADTTSSMERELTLLNLTLLAMRRWKALLAVGVAAAIVASVVLWVTPPTYEATAKILVMRTRSSDVSVGLDRTVIEPDYFAAVLESDAVLQAVLTELGLDQPPYSFDVERLRSAVNVSPLRNENSIEVSAELPALEEDTPRKVAELADAFIAEASRIAESLLRKDIERSRALFDEEYARVCDHLEEVRKQYQRVFLTAPILEKEKEIENLHYYQRQIQASLALAIADLEQKEPKLATLKEMLDGEDRLLTVTRALEEEPSLLGVYSAKTGRAATQLYSATSTTQVVNDVYTNLRDLTDTTRGDVVGLKAAVAALGEDIEDCNRRIWTAERIYNASKEAVAYWDNVLETAVLTHRAVDERHKLAAMAIVADRQDLINLFPAVPPRKPSGVSRFFLVMATPFLAMVLFLGALFLVEAIRVSLRE